MTSELESVIK